MIDTATIKRAAIDSDETGFASVLTNNHTVIALCDEVERLTTIASELQDLCDRQAKRLAEVEKDAARYVWLRDGNDAKHGRAAKIVDNHYGLEWDDLIDLAMEAK